MFATVLTTPARRVGGPAALASRSVTNAVAVATAVPTPRPVRMRAMNKPVTLLQSRNRVAAAMVTAIAGRSTARRPYQSDTCPASSRLTTTPTA
jgi:hypothetical protein